MYEAVIGEICGKSDEEIRKVMGNADVEGMRKRL